MATNSASTQYNFFVKSSSIKYVQVRPEVKDKKIGFNVQTVSKGVQSVTNVYSIGTQCITVVQDVIATILSVTVRNERITRQRQRKLDMMN